MSGFPGNSLLCNRNLYPPENKSERTIFSGFVFSLLIFDITSERFSVEKISVTAIFLCLHNGFFLAKRV